MDEAEVAGVGQSATTPYRAAGIGDWVAEAMDRLATTRISALGAFRCPVRNDDRLLDAQVRALESDVDGAVDLPGLALDRNLRFLWPMRCEMNSALAEPHPIPAASILRRELAHASTRNVVRWPIRREQPRSVAAQNRHLFG